MLTIIAISALIVAAHPQDKPKPPAAEELAAITERGRSLADYDAAAWHASDALQAKKPKQGRVVHYIARKTDQGWTVAFGKLDPAQNKFLITYEATQGKKPDQYEVKEFETPKEDTGFCRSAAQAIDMATQDFTKHFQAQQRPYNVAVLPAEKDHFWVYLVPAPTKPGIWPLGGDVRYLVSSADSKILVKRQLHKTIIEKEAPQNKDQKQVAAIHTHVLADVPEDTDVFHVLTRKPAVPELVVTKNFVYLVEPNGAIKFLGNAEDAFKKD